MIPQTFDAWRNCIVNDCKIDLTVQFAKTRLLVLEDKSNKETQKFASLYGEEHLNNVIAWLKRIV